MSSTVSHFGNEAIEKVIAGVTKMAKPVVASLGPHGENALIEKSAIESTITNDGVTIAKSIFHSDPAERAAANIVLQSALRTNAMAGDGTSTTIALAYFLLASFAGNPDNPYEVREKMEKYLSAFKTKVKEVSTPCSLGILKSVAKVSCQNESIAGLIADAFQQLGEEAIINIEESYGEDHLVVEKGLGIPFGYPNRLFATDVETGKTVLENVHVFISRGEISMPAEIMEAMRNAHDAKAKMVLISPTISPQVMGVMKMNAERGLVQSCPIVIEGTQKDQQEIIEDINLVLGAVEFSDESNFSIAQCEKVIITDKKTIFKKESIDEETIKAHLNAINLEIETQKDSEFAVQQLNKRKARLSNGYATIKVGGNTKPEITEKTLRVEDAVLACKTALKSGVVKGGGHTLTILDGEDMDGVTAQIHKAFGEVKSRILKNCPNKDVDETILDPADVIINAAENSISVAKTLLTASSIICKNESY